jgi:hypothetical protein
MIVLYTSIIDKIIHHRHYSIFTAISCYDGRGCYDWLLWAMEMSPVIGGLQSKMAFPDDSVLGEHAAVPQSIDNHRTVNAVFQ